MASLLAYREIRMRALLFVGLVLACFKRQILCGKRKGCGEVGRDVLALRRASNMTVQVSKNVCKRAIFFVSFLLPQ